MKHVFSLFCILLLFFSHPSSGFAALSTDVVLSDPVLIVESGTVCLNSDDKQESCFASTHAIPHDSKIVMPQDEPHAEFKILCPDFSIQSDPSSCHNVSEMSYQKVVQVPKGGIGDPIILPPTKGEQDAYHSAIQYLEQEVSETHDLYIKGLLCDLYVEAGRYKDANTCYHQRLEGLQDKNDMKPEQAYTLYQLALVSWKMGRYPLSLEQAREALDTYHTLEDASQGFQGVKQYFQQAYQETEEASVQTFIQHHLMLLAYYVFEEQERALEHAQRILTYYRESGQKEMETLVMQFMKETEL